MIQYATRSLTASALIVVLIIQTTACFTLIKSPMPLQSTKLQMSTIQADENPRLVGLAYQLDTGTRQSHSVAQNSAFVTGFFKGLSTRGAYSKLLTSLYFVYVAMEEAFDTTSEETVQNMEFVELRRVAAISEDMEYFYGAGWENKIVPSPAARKYVERVAEVARNEPKLLIAHQYTRYLGDLFGGQMMGGMASRSLNLDDGKGVSFYTFDKIDNNIDFITNWYKRLNELDLTDAEKEMIVDEANLVFQLNIDILEELEGSAFKAVWALTWKTFREKIGLA